MGFSEEFKRIFSNNSCSISGYDWTKDRPFDATSECYQKEVALVSSLTSEAYGKFGMSVEYFVKQISTKRDKLYGEDPLENVIRRFKLDVYTDKVPELSKSYQLQGMVYTEMLAVQCTVQHFFEASQLDIYGNDIYEPIEPLIGDLLYLEWLDKYYEIIHVRKFSENSSFLSAPITYELTLRMWRNNHEDVDVANQNKEHDNMDNFRKAAQFEETPYAGLNDAFDVDFKPVGPPAPSKSVDSSCDILSINDNLEDKHKKENKKCINDPVYKTNKLSEEIFDPFDDWD